MPLRSNQLIGFGHQRRAAAGETITYNDFAHANTQTGSTNPITMPSGWSVGSVVVWFTWGRSASGVPTEITTPTGWTKAGTVGELNYRFQIYAKVVAGGDPGSVFNGQEGNDNNQAYKNNMMLNFTFSTTVGSITFGDFGGENVSIAPTLAGPNSSSATAPLINLWSHLARVTIESSGTGYTYVDQVESGTTPDIRAAYKILNSAGADDSSAITWTDEGAYNAVSRCYLEIAA